MIYWYHVRPNWYKKTIKKLLQFQGFKYAHLTVCSSMLHHDAKLNVLLRSLLSRIDHVFRLGGAVLRR